MAPGYPDVFQQQHDVGVTSRTWRIENLSVGIKVPLRKAERRDRSGARRGLVTPGDIIPEWWARSSRNGGRHQIGTVGEIIPEWWATSSGISKALNPQAGDKTDRAVSLLIQDFHSLDKSAVAFRYSTNKNGAEFKFASGVVSIARLKDVMEGCEHYFEGSDDYYHAMVQNGPSLSDY